MFPRWTMLTAAEVGWVAVSAAFGRLLQPEMAIRTESDAMIARLETRPWRRNAGLCTVDLSCTAAGRYVLDRGKRRCGNSPAGDCFHLLLCPRHARLCRSQARLSGFTIGHAQRVRAKGLLNGRAARTALELHCLNESARLEQRSRSFVNERELRRTQAIRDGGGRRREGPLRAREGEDSGGASRRGAASRISFSGRGAARTIEAARATACRSP